MREEGRKGRKRGKEGGQGGEHLVLPHTALALTDSCLAITMGHNRVEAPPPQCNQSR